MEESSKLLKQIALITRPKIKEHLLIVMDKSTHEEHLSQTLRTNKKQFKFDITFLTGSNGIFIVTISNKKPYLEKSLTVKDAFIQITIPPGDYRKGVWKRN